MSASAATMGCALTGAMMVSTTELLRRSPNYHSASAVAEVDAADLTPDEFHRTYVLAHQPCVIRGAAAHWPATSWDIASLRAAVGDTTVGAQSTGVIYEPVIEYSDKRPSATSRMTMNEFLDEIEGPRPRVQMYAERLASLEQLSSDLGSFTGIDVSSRRARFYQNRFFLSRRGYTDWHVHTGDETLTAQLVGDKEFLLHEPSAMKTLLPMAKLGVWQTEPESWPVSFASLVPRRVVLHPGDVIYIPMHWWHAAEALGDSLNATYAHVFATPWRWMGDVRLQNVRFAVLAAFGRSLVESVRSKRPRYLRHLARVLGSVVVGLPAALWHNRARPASETPPGNALRDVIRKPGSKIRRLLAMPSVFVNFWTAYKHRFSRRSSSHDTVDYHLRNGATMRMMVGPNDVRILNEVFIDLDYEHPRFKPTAGWRVLDIGAHKGSFTVWALGLQPDMTIACFEPHPKTFELLSRNVPAIKVNAAVGAERGRVNLHEVWASTGQSSISRSRAETRGSVSRTYEVDVISLADALEKIGGEADAMKLDCEGSEYDLVMKAPTEDWAHVQRIAMEYDSASPSGEFTDEDLISRLKELGFSVDIKKRGILFAWR